MGLIIHKKRVSSFLLAAVVVFWPTQGYAYIGPAIAFIGYLFGPIVAVLAVIAMVFYLPAKKMIKKMKAKNKTDEVNSVSKKEG